MANQQPTTSGEATEPGAGRVVEQVAITALPASLVAGTAALLHVLAPGGVAPWAMGHGPWAMGHGRGRRHGSHSVGARACLVEGQRLMAGIATGFLGALVVRESLSDLPAAPGCGRPGSGDSPMPSRGFRKFPPSMSRLVAQLLRPAWEAPEGAGRT